MTKSYCLGFAFGKSDDVLLIRKNKPEFQKGKLNGVGGKLEGKETPLEAMIREFAEEADIVTTKDDWELRIFLQGKDWEVAVFCCFIDISNAKALTDEPLEVIKISDISSRQDLMFNLHWIIPYCLDDDQGIINACQKDMF